MDNCSVHVIDFGAGELDGPNGLAIRRTMRRIEGVLRFASKFILLCRVYIRLESRDHLIPFRLIHHNAS